MQRFLQIWVLHGPQPLILRFLRLAQQPPLFRWLPLILITIHLVVFFILPSGRNIFLGVEKAYAGWLTWMHTKNAFGIEHFSPTSNFLVYKVYHQDNTANSGYFPSKHTSPSLRFERWAVLSNAVSQEPNLSKKIAALLAENQAKRPLSVKMFSAYWDWDKNRIQPSTEPYQLEVQLKLKLLGSYNAFSNRWLTQ